MGAALTSCWQGLKHSRACGSLPSANSHSQASTQRRWDCPLPHSSSAGFAGTIARATVCLRRQERPFPAPALGAGYVHSGWGGSLAGAVFDIWHKAVLVSMTGNRPVSAQQKEHVVKLLGGEDGLGLPIRYHQGWVCRAGGHQAALVSTNSPVVRIKCKESVCSVCQYDLVFSTLFSREALSP